MKPFSIVGIHLVLLLFTVSFYAQGKGYFSMRALGKSHSPKTAAYTNGLYNHIPMDDDVIGGNTSIRNVAGAHLKWKGNPNGNGYGYFQRNRDLGQVFNMPKGQDQRAVSLVLRTSRGNNAIMADTPGAKMYLVFYQVSISPSKGLRINENGTKKGARATHGFDHQYNRADDFIEGDRYKVIGFYESSTGFPKITPTSQYVYDNGKGKPFGEQEGHLHYFTCDFAPGTGPILKSGKRYAFMMGFLHPGKARGLALAISTKVHDKENASFVKDTQDHIIWGIRREGNGKLPPTMVSSEKPPESGRLLKKLHRESLFPKNHYLKLAPTTNGFPDVDTYRTLQFYLKTEPISRR